MVINAIFRTVWWFGFGPIELSILFEEFGKALVIEPYLSTVVLSGTLLDKSTFANKNDIIEKICQEKFIFHSLMLKLIMDMTI